jgi:predicted Ser/Thr protein kinase
MTDHVIGAVVGQYRIEQIIGRGGMGVVYLAEHTHLERKVALKLLGPQLSENEAFRQRFLRESQVAAKLDHPNVVTVFDAGQVEGELYIAMRYVEGTDLRKVLNQKGALSPEETVDILGQVAAALDSAHALGLVHRDVRPGNILISSETAKPKAYISDFGLTKGMESVGDTTQEGTFLGSVDYAAPEQWKNEKLDGRTDVYALGCVLFECITGTVPFDREGQVAVMYAHMFDMPPKASSINPRLPAAFDDVVTRALAKSQEDRFATCTELIAEAARALTEADEPTGIMHPVLVDDGSTVGRQEGASGETVNPASHAGPGGTVVPIPTSDLPGVKTPPPGDYAWGEGQPLPGIQAAEPHGTPGMAGPPPPKRPSRMGILIAAAVALIVVAAAAVFVLTTDDDAADQADESAATVPDVPRNLIAFRSDRDGDQEIFVAKTDLTGVVQLTDNDAQDSDPTWSPDGRRIIFQSDSDGDMDIYVMNADGSGVLNLTNNEDEDTDPSWSPDGSQIAFSSDRDGDPEIYLMSPTGDNVRILTQNRDVADDDPTWTGDSSALVFQSNLEGNDDILFINADGSGLRNLTQDNLGPDEDPQLSPTERIMAFSRFDNIFLMDLSSGELTQISAGPARETDPAFSNDGQSLFFQSDLDGDEDLFVTPIDKPKPRRLTANGAFDADPDVQP